MLESKLDFCSLISDRSCLRIHVRQRAEKRLTVQAVGEE